MARGPLRSVLRALALGLTAALVLGAALLLLTGHRGLTVRSGSMEPAISTGDVVVQHPIRADALRVGDVVTFRDPAGADRLITHRVRGVDAHDGVVEVVTRGDANSAVERWSAPADGRVGLVDARVPALGHALAWTQTRAGRLLTVALPLWVAFGWGALALLRPRRRPAS